MLLKPLPPLDQRDAQRRQSNDAAGAGAWPLAALERLLQDCDQQPLWRDRADKAYAYVENVDNEQLTPLQKLESMRNGIEPRATNLIGRVINGVLGQEAKSRRDPVLEADDDDSADTADVLNVKLKEAQRETMADMAVSNAYKDQLIPGVGWTEVRRNQDPRLYRYSVTDVPINEMWWDWRGKRMDTSDWRWICRTQWKDVDEVVAAFPGKRTVIEQAVDGWANFFRDGPIDEEMQQGYIVGNESSRFRTRSTEWRDGARRRIRIYHVQYRVPAVVPMLFIKHRKIMLDVQNPLHVAAIERGLGRIEKVATMQIRNALYAGPFRLLDEATTLKRFIWTPFFAFRRHLDGTPFGMVEGMISPQDDYNESDQRMRWMLKAQQLLMDSDALDERFNTVADIADTMMRPDMVAILNPNRQNRGADALRFRNDMALQKELFERMQGSKTLVQDVPGVYNAQLGNASTGVTSGIAINSLVEQGMVSMGEINDNYMLGRRLTYENLVELIVEDHLAADMKVKVGSGSAKRVVVLNTRHPETGEPMNVVKDAPVKLGLGEAPSSPAYQMQVAQTVGTMIGAIAGTPQAALLLPTWVESNSMFGPNRKAIADDMRRMSGLPVAGDRQAAQEWQDAQTRQAAETGALQQASVQARLEKEQAQAAEHAARAEKTQSETLKNMTELAMAGNAIDAANDDQLIQAGLQEALS
jgi:hypothetical protein